MNSCLGKISKWFDSCLHLARKIPVDIFALNGVFLSCFMWNVLTWGGPLKGLLASGSCLALFPSYEPGS